MSSTRICGALPGLLSGFLGLALGCPGLPLNPLEPCSSGEHNLLNVDGECECQVGYQWCSPDDPENLDCCEDNNITSGGDSECMTGEFPSATCTPEHQGSYWCTNTDTMGPCGSKLYVCDSSMWTDASANMHAKCITDGYDFAYGCVGDGLAVVFECGRGPGTDCLDSDPAYCVSDEQLGSCRWGKETWDSCQLFCEGQNYEHGECDDSIPDDVVCSCCNSGDPGCPI